MTHAIIAIVKPRNVLVILGVGAIISYAAVVAAGVVVIKTTSEPLSGGR